MGEFNDCIDRCGLVEVQCVRRKLSWCNGHDVLGRSWAKLDRKLANSVALQLYPTLQMKYLPKRTSDHCPMLIHFQDQHDFGYIEKVEREFLKSKIELLEWQRREEIRFSQQAKKRWLSDGDNNTMFFHTVIAQKRRSTRISSMTFCDGSVLITPKDIHKAAVDYFQKFLSEKRDFQLPDLSCYISQCQICHVILMSAKFVSNEGLERWYLHFEKVLGLCLELKLHKCIGTSGFGIKLFLSGVSMAMRKALSGSLGVDSRIRKVGIAKL
ncbi:unnamed protein product [Fraxinus pennsylvanica]|uniref:Reverse transcriptase n=1 Tax=Fraxinus pennsylvanica TaxID=56036 RepID=A0AAD2E510_9LAMI|nr:unnamed protein product [Fraxinus pennsylvanica]